MNATLAKAMILLVEVVIISVGASGTGSALACSCLFTGTVRQEVEQADAVFLGVAEKVTYLSGPGTAKTEPPILVRFRIERWWKGHRAKQFTLHTVYNRFSCLGYFFKQGERYLVFAKRNRVEFTRTHFLKRNIPAVTFGTDICGHTGLAKERRQMMTALNQL